MNTAIDHILSEGYRNILLVPQPKYPAFLYLPQQWTVFARHFSKDPRYVGDRYPIGTIVNDTFYENIPF